MSDNAAREWRFYLDDMIGFAEKIIAYTGGLDQAGFVASGLNYDANVRNHRTDRRGRNAHPGQLPWRLLIASRNRLIHGCLGIDNDILWSIIQSDIPALLPRLRELRNRTT